MAVVIETTLGDITVDLYLDQRPVTCLNFLKLCKMKYYNYNLFHTIRSDFIAQTGDPTGEGGGGESIWGILEGPQKRFFSGEKMPKIRHTGAGLLSMVCTNDMMVGSQFFFTLAPDLDSLDGTHCVIGEVTEGHEILTKLNEVICDESNRPYRDVRITHTIVLEDPFNDPHGLRAPSRSPSPSAERLKGGRIAPDEEIDETQGKSIAEVQEMIEDKEAKARATILEIVGDLPDADIAPPENVLFVCKLNPVTTDDDLEIIFSRFGKIVSCEVIRDKKTENSLQYAFIEFENKKSCEDAYFKMDNVLIDDRRIHVDFSQSVSKMRWLGKGRGVQYLNDEVIKNPEIKKRDRDSKRDRNDHDTTSRKHQIDNKRDRNDHDDMSRKHHDDKKDRNDHEDMSRKHHNDNRRQYDKESKNSRNDRSIEHKQDMKERTSKKIHKSRSRSSSRNQSRERVTKNGEKGDRKKVESDRHDKRHRQSNSYRDRSPVRRDKNNSNHSPKRHKDLVSYREDKRSYDKKLERNNKSHEEDTETRKLKRKEHESIDRYERNKKTKYNHNNFEPKTPSPVANDKISKGSKRKDKKTCNSNKNSSKRKHKKSTSSDSDSSESTSSSSSNSSSSSENDREKSKAKRKKRKYSSSSSSDSSSTDSSSSSDSSSDSSSSSSDSEPSKKRSKKVHDKSKNNRKK